MRGVVHIAAKLMRLLVRLLPCYHSLLPIIRPNPLPFATETRASMFLPIIVDSQFGSFIEDLRSGCERGPTQWSHSIAVQHSIPCFPQPVHCMIDIPAAMFSQRAPSENRQRRFQVYFFSSHTICFVSKRFRCQSCSLFIRCRDRCMSSRRILC